VAAANAVSDVYAMGGRPLFALNLVAWNTDALPMSLLGDVLAGGQDIATAAGFVVAGGHTIDDPEPKYGMAVTGEVHPDRVLTNAGLRAGQDLILTKPLGVGVITTAIKADAVADDVVEAAVASMTRLNDVASRIAIAADATGCTDVTGFGLLGHLGRMTIESGVRATIEFDAVPFLPGAVEILDAGDHDDLHQLLIADAQTSGGLIFGVDPAHTDGVLAELAATGHRAACIGRAAAGTAGIVLR
jgi:selenide,water dikinase